MSHVRLYWVLRYANGDRYFGRFDGRWTYADALGSAALFLSEGEAENARQALQGEAADRVAKSHEHWPSPLWWDVKSGVVEVREVEQITRLRKSSE